MAIWGILMNHSAFSRMAHQLTSLKKPNFLYCLSIAKTVNGLTIWIPLAAGVLFGLSKKGALIWNAIIFIVLMKWSSTLITLAKWSLSYNFHCGNISEWRFFSSVIRHLTKFYWLSTVTGLKIRKKYFTCFFVIFQR